MARPRASTNGRASAARIARWRSVSGRLPVLGRGGDGAPGLVRGRAEQQPGRADAHHLPVVQAAAPGDPLLVDERPVAREALVGDRPVAADALDLAVHARDLVVPRRAPRGWCRGGRSSAPRRRPGRRSAAPRPRHGAAGTAGPSARPRGRPAVPSPWPREGSASPNAASVAITLAVGVDFEPGAEFAGHRIVAPLGRGGMGVVYHAVHLGLERDVALKVIAADRAVDPGFRERFRREARSAAALDHPGVITIYEAGVVEDLPYMTMRLVRGPDLGAPAAHRGPAGAGGRRRRGGVGRRCAGDRARGRARAPRHQAGQHPARAPRPRAARAAGRLRARAPGRGLLRADDDRELAGHGRLRGARDARRASRRRPPPTSTPSARCCTPR